METCSSGEELAVKVRKPYTITKQRERWTDEEHNRFLEALKLYGRAWQRIEEHIGTKTAVQIRSHAQKFFTKLEKEALSKGIPLEQALDIDIPPPRPKRKPRNPYPRKACMGTILSSKEKMVDVESSERAEDNSENGKCSVVLTLFRDAPCVSVSSENKSSATQQNFKDFVPFLKDGNDNPENGKSSLTTKENKELTKCTADSTDMDIGRIEGLHKNPQKKKVPKKSIGHKQPQEGAIASNCELQGTRSTAKHAGFYSKEENDANSGQCANPQPSNVASMPNPEEVPIYPIPPFNNPSFTATPVQSTHPVLSSFHPELPTFPSFNLLQNYQEAHRSLLNISSTFSNFIMSSLLQNPAAHAAACLAASFWSSLDGETVKSEAEALNCQTTTGQVNASPSMASIAAATVAAATAWWATHGLFPFCYPFTSTSIFFASTPPATGPTTLNNQSPQSSAARQVDHAQLHKLQHEHVLDPESPDDLVMQCSCSKSLTLASSDSDGRGGESPGGAVLNDSDGKYLYSGFHNHGNKTRNFKNIDSCFCGSNKSSSNEEETKVVLEKDGNKEADKLASFSKTNNDPEKKASFSETNCCRFRSSGSVRESWKEVSEEGRLAFQALFSREVLPQSFSPDGTTNLDDRIATYSPVNLKSNVCEDIALPFTSSESSSSRSNNHSDKSILTHDYGYGRLKFNQTGFKPYKRCSMEVKEGRASVADDKRNKRSRLAGETSTR